VLVAIARDYLIISAASVGVKRLFNMARDIYFYRRHYLKLKIIRALVITMCTDRFLLLKDLDNIKVIKEVKEVRLSKELKDQEIFKIKDLKGLISDKEDNNEDKDGEKDNKNKEPKDFALPVLRRAELN
jgi:hypothetical protein